MAGQRLRAAMVGGNRTLGHTSPSTLSGREQAIGTGPPVPSRGGAGRLPVTEAGSRVGETTRLLKNALLARDSGSRATMGHSSMHAHAATKAWLWWPAAKAL